MVGTAFLCSELMTIRGQSLVLLLAEHWLNRVIATPRLFARGSIFDRFPFLLPNLVCAIILALGVLIGILFLEETHEEKRYRRDVGLEIGDWITRRCRIQESCHISDKAGDANLAEAESLLIEDDEPPGYRTTDGTPRQQVSRSQSPSQRTCRAEAKRQGRPAS